MGVIFAEKENVEMTKKVLNAQFKGREREEDRDYTEWTMCKWMLRPLV